VKKKRYKLAVRQKAVEGLICTASGEFANENKFRGLPGGGDSNSMWKDYFCGYKLNEVAK